MRRLGVQLGQSEGLSLGVSFQKGSLEPNLVYHLKPSFKWTPLTMSSDQYTIIVSGQRFVLTRDQLESEPGNYFATYFLGEFEESSNNSREMILEKDPLLFTLIQAHLRGYDPFPITDAFTPKYMTRNSALKNLMSDTKYFGLVRLEEAIEAEMERRSNAGPVGTRIYRYWVR